MLIARPTEHWITGQRFEHYDTLETWFSIVYLAHTICTLSWGAGAGVRPHRIHFIQFSVANGDLQNDMAYR